MYSLQYDLHSRAIIHEDNAPMCCNMAMAQVYGVPGISFKGTGWGKD